MYTDTVEGVVAANKERARRSPSQLFTRISKYHTYTTILIVYLYSSVSQGRYETGAVKYFTVGGNGLILDEGIKFHSHKAHAHTWLCTQASLSA